MRSLRLLRFLLAVPFLGMSPFFLCPAGSPLSAAGLSPFSLTPICFPVSFRSLSLLRCPFLLLRALASLFLGTRTFLRLTPRLLGASSGCLLLCLYDFVRLSYQTLCTPAILCLISLRLFPVCFLFASSSRTGFLCTMASSFLCAFAVSFCCPAASRIKRDLADVARSAATRAITTPSVAVTADGAVHEASLVPSPVMLDEMRFAERA